MNRVAQVRFNRDFTCFTSCGDDGFRVFNTDPLMQLYHATTSQIGAGSVLKAEILRRSNIVAIVCKDCDYSVKIWDCLNNNVRRDVTFHQEVTNIRFLQDRLIVVLRSKIFLFEYTPDIKQLTMCETRENPLGILSINSGTMAQLVAFPGLERRGTIQVADLQMAEPHCILAPVTISAHEHELACVTLNSDGSKVASASRHGTIIRLHDVDRRIRLMEFRRGSNTALVYSLNFSPDSSFLCAASDKGTVHIFAVLLHTLNRRSALQNVAGIVAPYTDSQWAATNFTVPAELACVCSFLRDKRSSVVVICVDGSYHTYRFPPDVKSCAASAYERFLELGDSMEM